MTNEPPKQDIKWPEKKDRSTDNVMYERGFNDCHDQFMKVINEQSATYPTKCKCERHPDSVFTVTVRNDIPYCPGCGGVVMPRIAEKELVPLDEEAMEEIRDCVSHYVDQAESKDVDRIMNLISKFGTPSPTVLSVEELSEIISNNVRVYPGGLVDSEELALAIHQKLIGGK